MTLLSPRLQRIFKKPLPVLIAAARRRALEKMQSVREYARVLTKPSYTFSLPFAEKQVKVIRGISPVDLPFDAHFDTSTVEKACEHSFNLLGSGWKQVVFEGDVAREINGPNRRESFVRRALIDPEYRAIDWQTDFKSGFRWAGQTWSKRLTYGDQSGVDVKVPWELARMQHLPLMALAARQGNCAALAREFRNQVLDFSAANPPGFGVNWICTMDVGIRIANWLFAYDLFTDAGAVWDASFDEVFVRCVYEHAHFIAHHLEWHETLRSNHYLADIAGLYWAAAHLPDSEASTQWRAFAHAEIEREVLEQFNAEGSNFEGSTSYHRLSSEMALWTHALACRVGAPAFSNTFTQRLQKMAMFTRSLQRSDGTIPQIGDNDSGRFFLIPFAAESPAIKAASDTWHLEPWPEFGVFIYRRAQTHFAIRCGTVGQKGNGGHAHNDQLSFELWCHGPMIVDPGTYVYTPFPEERNRFRSTARHNTVWIEGHEQNHWLPGRMGLFSLTDAAAFHVHESVPESFAATVQTATYTHERRVSLVCDGIDIVDTVRNLPEGECRPEIRLHFAPGVLVEVSPTGYTLTLSKDTARIEITAQGEEWRIFESVYSAGYGLRTPIKAAALAFQSTALHWKICL